MIKIDLITGFLGSGKTTFIRKYANYLVSSGKRICILENDFGAVNVDMLLLQDLLGDNCDIEMVSGAYDKDCHRRRFKTKLIAMAMNGFERVIIEPSGIYDVDEFFDVLREEPLDRWYEIGNVITICDGELSENISENAEYMLASQLANSGEILLSRCGQLSSSDIEKTVSHLNRIISAHKLETNCKKNIICKEWDCFDNNDWERISHCGYCLESYEKKWLDEGKAFDSLYFMNLKMTEDELVSRTRKLLSDKTYGDVFRVKGFMQVNDNKWIEINATGNTMTVAPIERGQEVFIVIGENLNEDKIKKFWEE